ncbi:hypothetical protein [Pseudonocardia pini]|uniref:hypothetical protein n=1 Tax=Pseudonocardia pini TaxID=2758030 RepID=UPI0015F115C7|nr:hypothetical protein [Pseudonocardia pini]
MTAAVSGAVSTDDPTVVADVGGTRVVDTRALPWRGTDAPTPRVLSRTLARDAEGDAVVDERWMTAWSPTSTTHGYRLVHEYYLCLAGEFTHNERDPETGRDTPVVFRPGTWMDRSPGSLTSGALAVPQSVRGIGWLTRGPDPYVGLAEAASLTTTLDGSPVAPDTAHEAAGEQAGVVLANGYTTVLDSHAMPWAPSAGLPGARERVLSRRLDGDAGVVLLGIPAGPAPWGGGDGWRGHHDFREFWLVLEGELTVRLHDGPGDRTGVPVTLGEGHWLDRPPGAVWGVDPGEATPTGATILSVRLRRDTVLPKERDKHAVWTRTVDGGPRSIAPRSSVEELLAFRRGGATP